MNPATSAPRRRSFRSNVSGRCHRAETTVADAPLISGLPRPGVTSSPGFMRTPYSTPVRSTIRRDSNPTAVLHKQNAPKPADRGHRRTQHFIESTKRLGTGYAGLGTRNAHCSSLLIKVSFSVGLRRLFSIWRRARVVSPRLIHSLTMQVFWRLRRCSS